MKKRFIALAVVVLAAGGLLAAATTASADPNNPTFVTGVTGFPYAADGFDIAAAGLVNISHTLDANCPVPGTNDSPNVSIANNFLLDVSLPKASCEVHYDGTAGASATIADVSLLGGAIKLTAIDSVCTDIDGLGSAGSTYGTLITKYNYSRNGTGGITIPGVASIIVDQRAVNIDGVSTVALSVTLLPGVVNGHKVALQTLQIGGCSIHTIT